MPAISVIVPVYKVEEYLDRCVESIIGQSFSDFELILVDDGSPDNCPSMCDAWAEKDARIRVIHKENGGLSSARNAAIDWVFENSDSRWFTFIDSDDWVHPKMLELMLNASLKHDVDVCLSEHIKIDNYNECFDEYDDSSICCSPESYWIKNINSGNATMACGKLYKKSCFENMRYPVGKLHEDEYVTYRILYSFKKIAVVPHVLYYYYQNAQSITNSQWTPKRLDALDALEMQVCYFEKNNYKEALKFALTNYACAMALQLQNIRNSSISHEKKKVFEKNLKKRLKKFLKKKKTYLFEKHIWIYEMVFPIRMNIYWKFNALQNKLK